jgi:NAD(P)-dependent dehydrogenase (short-subunit alcohol dehydrogenase family)
VQVATEGPLVKVARKVAIVTGGGNGIGAAIARRIATEGASVLVADLDADAASAVSAQIGQARPGAAIAVGGDVADEACVEGLIEAAEAAFGPVDLYFANAGMTGQRGLEAEEDVWDRVLDVNLRAHVRAARLLLPGWLERGSGYFVSTASAAGLLTQIGSPVYAVTKHAAVGFAEWLSVTYGNRGVRVSCLCPMGVNTNLLNAGRQSDDPSRSAASRAVTSAGDVLEPDQVAESVIEGMADERFLILPHADVLTMYQQKASDYDRWLRGMRRYQDRLLGNT